MIDAAVVDASVAIKWVVDEQDTDRARSLSGTRFHAPDLLLVECANVLWKKVIRGELSRDGAVNRTHLLAKAPVTVHSSAQFIIPALELSLKLRYPAYDCVYLALARRNGIPLVTADAKFAEAVRTYPELSALVETLDAIDS